MRKRVLIVCVVIAVVAAAGYWYILSNGGGVVATVNGQKITRADLNRRLESAVGQYEAYGIEVTDELLANLTDGALDELVVEALLAQSAQQAGIIIADSEVEEFYQQMVSEYETEEQMIALLKENNYTVARLRADIARHLMINKYEEQYIDQNVDPASLEITEAQKRELYDSYAEQYEDIPPYEEVVEYLEAELRDQRIYELGIIEDLVEQLRGAAAIEITL